MQFHCIRKNMMKSCSVLLLDAIVHAVRVKEEVGAEEGGW